MCITKNVTIFYVYVALVIPAICLTSTGHIQGKFSLTTRDIVFRIIYDKVDQ